LVSAGQLDEAEKVLEADLVRNPNSGWTLAVLEKCLRMQGKLSQADSARDRFMHAWRRADFELQP
jgi:hypothetical protein